MKALCARHDMRHYATSGDVASSIPHGDIFHIRLYNPSGRTMALGFTQIVTEMSNKNIVWVKEDRCVGLTTLLPSYTDFLEILRSSTSWNSEASPGIFLP
jgi:hypothetical protein